ncbi:MAG: dTMP kinase [Balneolaceae bacterium]|nr:dTMP kinase [Balneolaceae bacterium]MCH8547359.1 dTMP kinase [Balneolaceae bacterium]
MLITFEGIDGCGKSTQIEKLKHYFEKEGTTVRLFREPGGTELSEKIRHLLLHDDGDMDPVTELLLFSAARSQLISEKVLPLLREGSVVILDRFYDSTTAYQGFGRQSAPLNEIETLNALATHHTVPDVTFYLRISPEDAALRTAGSEKDRMEKAGDQFFKKVAAGYDQLAEANERFITIDAARSVEEIHAEILTHLKNRVSS